MTLLAAALAGGLGVVLDAYGEGANVYTGVSAYTGTYQALGKNASEATTAP